MSGLNLRKAKNLVGEDCIGVDVTDGEFFIKFKVAITQANSEKIAELREASGAESLKKQKGSGKDKKSYAVGKVPVSKDPRNGGSLNLSKHYA